MSEKTLTIEVRGDAAEAIRYYLGYLRIERTGRGTYKQCGTEREITETLRDLSWIGRGLRDGIRVSDGMRRGAPDDLLPPTWPGIAGKFR